jgi:hypothetical protein
MGARATWSWTFLQLEGDELKSTTYSRRVVPVTSEPVMALRDYQKRLQVSFTCIDTGSAGTPDETPMLELLSGYRF